jgi:hypothetical protein
MEVYIHAFSARKKVLDALAVYMNMCKASVGTNAFE